MTEADMIKRAVIAGASRALLYKSKRPIESDSEILKKVSGDLREIINNIVEVH